MRYIKTFFIAVLAVSLFTSCEGFLDRAPETSLTEPTAFLTYENFKTYSWNLYGEFSGHPTSSDYSYPVMQSERLTDNINRTQASHESPYAYQKKTEENSTNYWSFTFIRRVNIMLQNIDNSEMDDRGKRHWRSVGYFFRAYKYYDLLAYYGDVPWIDRVVGDTDEDIYLGTRDPRETVAQNILNDLLYAEQNIIAEGDGVNTINLNVVRALISRFCLFEGTWRKYHGMSGSETFLDHCIRVSEEVVNANPLLMASYDDKFNSEELAGKPGILLCIQYDTDKRTHNAGRVPRTSAWHYDLTKDAVDSYLCSDGRPVSTSAVYAGDKDVYDQFRNRDRRLYYTVLPPYKVAGVTGSTSKTWSYHADEKYREYIDLMETITPENGKRLPVSNFAGNLCNMAPHFNNFQGGQGFIVTELGFYCWKYYNTHQVNQNLGADIEDFPVFTVEEVMLNYAEAAFERGKLTQVIVDKTINKLRARAYITDMTISDITAGFDLSRDQSVDPVLWEIRRERRIELMGDGFRFNDLKRWKKGEYVNKQPLGVWVKNSDFGNKLKLTGGTAGEGYVYYFGEPAGWLEKYYLEPLPITQVVLNPNLLPNNPGWTDYDVNSETE